MDIKFVDYKATPTEKHFGIATVDLGGVVLLRYKIAPGKDGTGFFPMAPSYKVSENGSDVYLPAFLVDSRSLHEKIMNCVRDGYKSATAKKVYQESASIHDKSIEDVFGEVPF